MDYHSSTVRKVRRLAEPEGAFMPWGILPWLGVLALSMVSCAAIQGATKSKIQNELASTGQSWVEVSASGRTVTLTGAPPTGDAEKQVISIANAAEDPSNDWLGIPFKNIEVIESFGAPKPDTQSEPDAPPPAPEPDAPVVESPNWNFAISNSVLSLNGEVPNEATRLDIIKTVQNTIETNSETVIEDKLVVLNERPPRGYREVAAAGARAISQCDEGLVSFRDSVLDIDCELPRASEEAVRRELTS